MHTKSNVIKQYILSELSIFLCGFLFIVLYICLALTTAQAKRIYIVVVFGRTLVRTS